MDVWMKLSGSEVVPSIIKPPINQTACHFRMCAIFTPGPHDFPETSFHRIVVLPKWNFAESLLCRKKIAQSHLTESSNERNFIMPKDIFLNRCSAERHFSESAFRRTSFLRIVVQPNVVFPKLHLSELHFAGIVSSETTFNRTLNRLPAYTFDQCACWRDAIEDIRN